MICYEALLIQPRCIYRGSGLELGKNKISNSRTQAGIRDPRSVSFHILKIQSVANDWALLSYLLSPVFLAQRASNVTP